MDQTPTQLKYPNHKVMAAHQAVCGYLGIADPAFCVLMIFDSETQGYRAYAGHTDDVKVVSAVMMASQSMLAKFNADVAINPQNHEPGTA